MKSITERKKLHGEEYVAVYKKKSPLRLERLLQFMKLDGACHVADFACGNGMLMELIATKVKFYTGIDFSEPFIQAANEKKERLSIHNAVFLCSDINEFCQSHQKAFDVGFAMDFSEHVYDEEWGKILENIRKSLKLNGKLYLHTPNAEFFLERMKSANFIVKQFPEHIAVRTPEQNAAILRKAGFEVTRVLLIPHYNVLRFLHPLSYLPFMGKYFKARIFIEATR